MAKISTSVSVQESISQIYTIRLSRDAATGVGLVARFDFPTSNRLRLMHIKASGTNNIVVQGAYVPHVLVSLNQNEQFFPMRIGETLHFNQPTGVVWLKMIDDAANKGFTMRLYFQAIGLCDLESQRTFSEIERVGTVGLAGTLANGATVTTDQVLDVLPPGAGIPADTTYKCMIRLHETIVTNFELASAPTHVLNIYDPQHLCGRVFAASNLKIPGNCRLVFKNESGANLDYAILCIYYLPVTWTV